MLPDDTDTALKRSVSLPMIVLYGLGTILGAGIYVLVGEVAGVAGMQAPFAFLLAAVLAAFSAFSYAELSSRFPRSAGEAIYVSEGLNSRHLALAVGLMVVMVGMVSSATISRGFFGYLDIYLDVPSWFAITTLVITLGLVAFWGINESVSLTAVFTVIEVIGLLLIIWVGRDAFGTLPQHWPELLPSAGGLVWHGILLGSFLAFYAFIGFEDMVNVAEEVKDVERNLPRAIMLVLVIVSVLYVVVAMVAVLAVAPAQLGDSDAPLAMIYERTTGQSPFLISMIGMFAVVNGALVQIIMASRVLYGMARQGWLHAGLGHVNRRTRTPDLATALVTASVLLLALFLPLVTLAKITSFITLLIFTLIHLSLIAIKRRGEGPAAVCYPVWIPVGGVLSCVLFLGYQVWHWIF